MCCFDYTHSKLMEVLILWRIPRDGQDIVCSFQNGPVLSSSISFRKMGIRIYSVCPVTRDSAVSCSAGGYCLHFVGAKAERKTEREGGRETAESCWWIRYAGGGLLQPVSGEDISFFEQGRGTDLKWKSWPGIHLGKEKWGILAHFKSKKGNIDRKMKW